MILAIALAAAQDWWDPAWSRRRPISIAASGVEIPAGAVIEVGFDPEELGITELARDDRADYRVVGPDGPVPFAADREGRRDVVWLRLPAAIPASGSARYFLYYGNAGAEPTSDPSGTFAARVDFRATDIHWPSGWAAEPTGEGLRVLAGPGRAAVPLGAPAIRGPFAMEVRVRSVAGEGFVGLHLLPHEGEPGEEMLRRIEDLVARLGGEAFEDREAAQRELIEIGRSALPALRGAAAGQDPEVSLRARTAIQEIEARLGSQDRWIGWRLQGGQTIIESRAGEATQRQPMRLAAEPWILQVSRERVPAGLNLYVAAGPISDSVLVPAVPPRMPSDESPLSFDLEIEGAGLSAVLVEFRAWVLPGDAQVELLPAERAP